MTDGIEKFTIEIADHGMKIRDGKGVCLELSALEALMVLDILQHEEENLKAMARASSPMPIRIKF